MKFSMASQESLQQPIYAAGPSWLLSRAAFALGSTVQTRRTVASWDLQKVEESWWIWTFQHLEPNLNHQVLRSTDAETRSPLLKVQMEACSQSGSSYTDTASQYPQHRFFNRQLQSCLWGGKSSLPQQNLFHREPMKDKKHKHSDTKHHHSPPCLAGRGANTELMVPSRSTWRDNHGTRTWSYNQEGLIATFATYLNVALAITRRCHYIQHVAALISKHGSLIHLRHGRPCKPETKITNSCCCEARSICSGNFVS